MSIHSKLIKNPREELTPQMTSYDLLGIVWQPFLMYFHTPNFKSHHINTDRLGFRFTNFHGNKYSIAKNSLFNKDVSFIIGGSTAFGVGSTSDDFSIPSLLSNKSGRIFLNLGGRAFTSNQELILFNQIAHLYPNIKSVIIFSGLNDLFLSNPSLGGGFFGNFFFGNQFKSAMNNKTLSSKRKLLKIILYPFFGDKLNYGTISRKGLSKNIMNKFVEKYSRKNKVLNNKININYASEQIYKNLFIWKNLSRSFPFSLKFVLQPVPEWCNKKLSKEESSLFSHLNKYDHHKHLSSLNKKLYKNYALKIRNICASLKIDFYDMNRLINKSKSSKEWMFVDRAHLTDRGNDIVSDLLYAIEEGRTS